MNETQEKKTNKRMIVSLLILVVAMVVGVKLLFAALAAAIPAPADLSTQIVDGSQTSQSVVVDGSEESGLPAPSFCPYCGDELTDSFQWGQFCPYCGEKVE